MVFDFGRVYPLSYAFVMMYLQWLILLDIGVSEGEQSALFTEVFFALFHLVKNSWSI